MQKLFGTDGIRAKAGSFPLDRSTITVIGTSVARIFQQSLGRPPKFVTGRDTRESGEWIEAALHSAASAAGAEIESAGVMTTPGVAFIASSFGFDAGIVISASHNPFEDNGIKVFLPNGRKLDEITERKLEQDIAAGINSTDTVDIPVISSRAEIFHKAYIDHLAAFFPNLSLAGMRLVSDCANGASCTFVKELFTRLGADVSLIHDSPNGRNINENCGSLHLEHLQKAVVERGADLGVAYDGDADRALFVDEAGNIVDGDATLWILARRLKDEGQLANSSVVATVMSNIGLEIALRSQGIELIRTAVGDKYVLDKLIESGSSIGGEQSGHIIFPHESLVGDGMLTTLFMLDALVASGKRLSEVVAGFTRYPQILINVKVREKRPFESVPEIAAAAARVEDQLDGNGRLLLRYSGTENLARVMIEGSDQIEIERQANDLAAVIASVLG